MIAPQDYFSLERFAHKALWKEEALVWDALHLLNDYLRSSNPCLIEIEIPKGVFLEKPELISIGEGTIIEPGVMIQGPCIIGKGCVIRHGAYIRESVICGDHCVIGHSAEIKHSILLDKAHATHFVYVGDSILGNEVNLGAGVKCANLRLDRSEVLIRSGEKKIQTGLKKFGAIVGDRVQIGCNSVLNPGTMVGKGSVFFPLVNLGGIVPPYSQVSMEKELKIQPLKENILDRIGK